MKLLTRNSQIALAWLWSKPVVAAPILGSLKAKHIDDAMAAVSVTLTSEEIARLEAPTPCFWSVLRKPRRDSAQVPPDILIFAVAVSISSAAADGCRSHALSIASQLVGSHP